jgi:hypothetical protein
MPANSNQPPLTPEQLKCVQTLLSKQGADKEQREWIVSVWTNHRTTSVCNLGKFEASKLIGHLKSQQPLHQASEKMRRKILSMAHEMGWEMPGTRSVVNNQVRARVDMKHVNDWCLKYGYLHKKLDAYTYEELPKLVSQFEGLYKQHLNKV